MHMHIHMILSVFIVHTKSLATSTTKVLISYIGYLILGLPSDYPVMSR